MTDWLKTPAGRYVLAWEQLHLDAAVADLFGFHALQLGLPELEALRANRMPHRWVAVESPSTALPAADPPSAGLSSGDLASPGQGSPDLRSPDPLSSDPLSPDRLSPDLLLPRQPSSVVTSPAPTSPAEGSPPSSAVPVPRAIDGTEAGIPSVHDRVPACEAGPAAGPAPAGSATDHPVPQAPADRIAIALHCDFDALPFDASSLDLVILPHALELARDPHLALREVERVLRPEGRVVIVGFNPSSLWGLRQWLGRGARRLGIRTRRGLYLPSAGEFMGYRRLRDWLRLLSFEVEAGRFGCYRPPALSQQWLDRFAWADRSGERWWPVFGAVYFVVAVKRVRGMRLVGLVRAQSKVTHASAPVVATPQHSNEKKQR